ncbi:MAG: tRNA (cytidine/uridine-2'-O-)-methyltransferase TrmJ [Nitrosomonas sp.]|nr:MAG: tRNA (cytidine/uridine-2'-O-)-methyltransferase TrmJ [Nitrosomonas sp.]
MNRYRPLDNVRIVLSHTSHPGNIGAAARALKTMGLSSLYLINPRSFPDKEAEARAANAKDILDNVRVCANINDALDGTALAAAISARPRGLSHDVYDSRQGAQEIIGYARENPVALVFGAESSGLTTMEVGKCHITIHIPADPDYSSLNLASAVQVMSYELRMALPEIEQHAQQSSNLASFNDVELFFRHLEQVMIASKFLNPEKPKRLMQRVRRLFSRARLEKGEVKFLRGFLSALDKMK